MNSRLTRVMYAEKPWVRPDIACGPQNRNDQE